MNQKQFSLKEMIKEMYTTTDFQPQNIQECLWAGLISVILGTLSCLLICFLVNIFFGDVVLNSYFWITCGFLGISKFIRYFILLWRHKIK